MAISVVASASANVRANTQSVGITVTHGFTLANNDVLYAFLGMGDDPGTGWASTSGGTWTELLNNQSSTGVDAAIGVMRRIVTNAAGEPSTYTFTRAGNNATDNLVVVVVQVRGVDVSGTPENATAVSSTLAISDFTPDNVDITTTVDNCGLLICHLASGGTGAFSGANTRTPGAPSGFSNVDSDVFDNGTNLSSIFIEVAFLADAGVATTETIGVWTGTPDDATSDGYTAAVAMLLGATIRNLATNISAATATPNDVDPTVIRDLAANISAATSTPNIVGNGLIFRTSIAASTSTPDTVASTVARDLAANISVTTASPDTIATTAIRDLAANITPASITPNVVTSTVSRDLASNVTVTTATPNTITSTVVRELATNITVVTVTPDDVDSQLTGGVVDLATSITVVTSTPNTAASTVIRDLATGINAASSTPNLVTSTVVRDLASAITVTTNTPNDVDIAQPPVTGVLRVTSSARVPFVQATVHQTIRG